MLTWTPIKFEVPIPYVATYVPRRADLDSDFDDVPWGSHVRIQRGKHAGKTGRITVIDRKYVKVLEDVTDILVSKAYFPYTQYVKFYFVPQIGVRRDNVEISGEVISRPPETKDEPRKTKTTEGDAATSDTAKETVQNPDAKDLPMSPKEGEKDATEKTAEGQGAAKVAAVKCCTVEHLKEGFEGQLVYVWRGHFKGKIGWVLRMSGSLCRISLESAMKGRSVIDLKSEYLVAYVRASLSHLHLF